MDNKRPLNVDSPLFDTPTTEFSNISDPIFDLLETPHATKKFNDILEEIYAFEENLDENHEIGVQLETEIGKIEMYLNGLYPEDLDKIHFLGEFDGEDKEISFNFYQIKMILISLPRRSDHENPYRISQHSVT